MEPLFIIPANSKQGKLIFSLFNKFDLILVGCGFALTILGFIILNVSTFQSFLFAALPLVIATILVIPIPNYHNVFVVIKELIEFFYKRRNYKWEGWCSKDEFK